MKKLFVLLVVVALTLVTSAVMAAEVTVGGEIAIRSRNFGNMDMNDNATDDYRTQQRDTQTRMKIDVNAKAGDVKGKLQLWNDFETWGDNPITSPVTGAANPSETQPGSTIDVNNGGMERNTISFREAWISFPLPVIPVTITGGHQLLTIGNGWFIRQQHYGADAWVISNTTGPNTAAIVNIKGAENETNEHDDADSYTLLDVFKINDNMTVCADITMVRDRTDKNIGVKDDTLMNFGVNFNGKVGPVALKAEVDLQTGSRDNVAGVDNDYKGNQFVIQGAAALGPVTINATLARGSGEDVTSTSPDIKTYQNFLDIDPHYTFLYEYKMNTAAGAKNTGFANTTAIGVGATFAATKNLTVGADVWQLMATEDVSCKMGECVGKTDKLGMEVDVKVNWNVAENLKWNWVIGMLLPDEGMGKDMATGAQGILSFAF